ncbi:hypothetical protein ACRAKI_19995 [Saccharothrix isguenensis]
MTDKITFDEAMYDKLIAVLDELEQGLLHKATSSGPVPLNSDFTVVPGSPEWKPALDLLNKGKEFGGSVEEKTESLRQALVKFRNALKAAKGVFKDTDDLADYDISSFIAEYPDFQLGSIGGPGAGGSGGGPGNGPEGNPGHGDEK